VTTPANHCREKPISIPRWTQTVTTDKQNAVDSLAALRYGPKRCASLPTYIMVFSRPEAVQGVMARKIWGLFVAHVYALRLWTGREEAPNNHFMLI